MAKVSKKSKSTGLPIIQPFAASIDIGSRFHVAAVSPDLCDQPVQTFQTSVISSGWLIGSSRLTPKWS